MSKIIFMRHGGGLREGLLDAKVFDSEEEMKKYIVSYLGKYITEEDIVIEEESEFNSDDRIGWENERYVCVKKFGDKNYIEMYGCPQCIGYCATKFPWPPTLFGKEVK